MATKLTFEQKKYQLSLKDRLEIVFEDLIKRKKLHSLEWICLAPLFLFGFIADIIILVDVDRRLNYLQSIIQNEGMIMNFSSLNLNEITIANNCSLNYNVRGLYDDYMDKRRAYCFFFFLYLVIIMSLNIGFFISTCYREAMKEYYSFRVTAKLSKFCLFLWNAVPQACIVIILYNLDHRNNGINCLYASITPTTSINGQSAFVKPFQSYVQDSKLVYVLLCAIYSMAAGIYHGYFIAKSIKEDMCGNDNSIRSYVAWSRMLWYLAVVVTTAIFSFPIVITAKGNPVTQSTGTALTYLLIVLLCLFTLAFTFISVTLDFFENYLEEYIPFTKKLPRPIFYYIMNLLISCAIVLLGYFIINLMEFILIFVSFYIYYRTLSKGRKLMSNSYKFGKDVPPKLDTDGITYNKDPVMDPTYYPQDQLNTLNRRQILAMKDDGLNDNLKYTTVDVTINEDTKTFPGTVPYYTSNVVYSTDERLV